MLVLVTPPGATLPVEIQNDVIVGTDMSGVKTEMTGTMLNWMQDHSADGLIFIAPPGAAKSAVGKAAGATAGIPTVAFDLSAMQSSLVGGSGERLRAALQVVDAISQRRRRWIATCILYRGFYQNCD